MRNQAKNQKNNKNENLKSLETQAVESSKIASFYERIETIKFETACYSASAEYIDELKEKALRADKKKINSLMKKLCPDFYDCLSLDLYNPYNYLRTQDKIIVIHSATEYVFKISLKEAA